MAGNMSVFVGRTLPIHSMFYNVSGYVRESFIIIKNI